MITALDIPLWITRMLPPDLRKNRRIAWLVALCSPVDYLQQAFLQYRTRKLRELTYNSQTMVLERLLNQSFNATGIYIENVASAFTRNYIYQLAENERPLYARGLNEDTLRPFIFALAEFESAFDFIVFVPAALVFDKSRMNAMINQYKIAGMRHTIQTY